MEDEAEVIKKQMEDTRTSLSEKLEALENKVVNTVEQTTGAVTDTVTTLKEAVQATVGSVKDTVENTVDSVKEKVQDTVESVKETFDLSRQVDRHPWAMLGGSVAVGFLLGRFVPGPAAVVRRVRSAAHGNGKHRARFTYPDTAAAAAAVPGAAPATGATAAGGTAMNFMSTLTDALAPALDTLKSVAIGTATGVLGEMLVNAVPPAYKEEVRNVVGEVTTKLGGRQVWHPEHAAGDTGGHAADSSHRFA